MAGFPGRSPHRAITQTAPTPRFRGWRTAALLVVALLGAADPSHGQPSIAADRFSSMDLPGTPEGLARVAGLAGGVERASLVSEIVRALYGEQEASSARREQVRSYLESLDASRVAWQAAGADGTLALPKASDSIPAPVSTALEEMGWRPRREGGRWRLVPGNDTRQAALQAAGVDLVALTRRLESGERVAWPAPSFAVPLPLTPALWLPLLGAPARGGESLGLAILRDRRAALLYYGLSRCGRGTLAAAARSPALLDALGRGAPVFAAFGGSIVVEGDRVVTPGGDAYGAAWEALLGQSRTDPASFIQALLARDDGHLAWFYETLAGMPASTLAFAAGGRQAAPAQQAAAVAELYRAFEQVTKGLAQPDRNPLLRPPLEPALLLIQLQASPAGRLSPPRARGFWQAAFASEETDQPVRLEPGEDVDAAFLIDRVFAAERQHRYDRFDAVLFAQRVFGATPDAELAEAALALRGFGRFRSLLLTMERLGVRDAGTYARAVRRAARLGEVRDPVRASDLYSQFQGALALVERLFLVRRVTEADAHRLLGTLVDLDIGPDDSYHGAIAGWLDTELVRALRLAPLSDDTPLLEALAGVSAPATTPAGPRAPAVQWLDWPYRLDLDRAALRRLVAVRTRQGGSQLSAVLGVARAARPLTAAVRTLPELQERLATLEGALARLGPSSRPGERSGRALAVRPATMLRAIARPSHLPRAAEAGEMLVALSDLLLGDVLRSLAYAPHLGEPSGPILLGSDVSYRHDFGVTIKDPDTRWHAAWSLPQAPTGYGLTWQVWGALLGLDVGLSRFALRPVAVGVPNAARGVSEVSRKAMVQALALLQPFDVTDSEMHGIAAAIGRGRGHAEALRAAPDRLSAAADRAGLAAGSVRRLAWRLQHERDGLEAFFSMPELWRLGRNQDEEETWGAQWGAPRLNWDGSLLRGWVAPARAQAERGRSDTPFLVAGFPDLFLRTAELMAELKLPARMVGPLARAVVGDFLDEVTACREDEPVAWSAFASRYPRARLESAVSALTADGTLTATP